MLFNYISVGLRNILKYKVFSFINIFGLALGMTVCLLIISMLTDQKNFDQFNEKKDRIYRVLSEADYNPLPFATTPYPLGSTLKEEFDVTEDVTQLITGVGGEAQYKRKSMDMRGFFGDESFFNVFSFELGQGDPRTALSLPNSMVITHDMAKLLFGAEDPIGKTVAFVDKGLHHLKKEKETAPVEWGNFTIRGVLKDVKYKTHLKFDVLLSSSSRNLLINENKVKDYKGVWSNYDYFFTYALLKPQKNENDLNHALAQLSDTKFSEIKKSNNDFLGFNMKAQKLTDITPGVFCSYPPSMRIPIEAYYFVSFMAFLIMLSACLNYANLSTSRALMRAKEIGVRKAAGATKQNLVFQFLAESVITSFFALGMAILLLMLVKATFLNLGINTFLDFSFQNEISIYLVFMVFALFIGLVAGIYPAMYLSKFEPVKALGNDVQRGSSKMRLKNVLSASQFVVSLFFIVTSILIYNQLEHFLKYEYKFDSTNLVNLDLQGNDFKYLSNELAALPEISMISACEYIPAVGGASGISIKKNVDAKDDIPSAYLSADEQFLENLGLQILEGEKLVNSNRVNDANIILNEAAVKALGYERNADVIGESIVSNVNNETLVVVGVVEDFRVRMLMEKDDIIPLVMRNQPDQFNYLNLKIASEDVQSTMLSVKNIWEGVFHGEEFKYRFFDEHLNSSYESFNDGFIILRFFAFLAITIACLGLLGMVTYTVERRMKEVAIRRALGAGDFAIAYLLSKQFLKLLLISILISTPISFFINNLWLSNIPNRVDFGVGTVIVGVLILVLLGLVTISAQTMKAVKSNPLKFLRS